MKKVVFAIVAFFILAISFSSCRSADKCPAYGNVEKYQVDRP